MAQGSKLKEYIGKQMVGKTLRFRCDCTAFTELTGTVVDYYVVSNEIVLKVQRRDGKIFDIGENHPSMKVFEA